jgi:hypothetical protein
MDVHVSRTDGTGHEIDDVVYSARVGPDDSPSEATVEVVSTALDRDPLELVPLQRRVDTDALDGLFRGDDRGRVVFDYEGCSVTVHADGRVVAEPPGDPVDH